MAASACIAAIVVLQSASLPQQVDGFPIRSDVLPSRSCTGEPNVNADGHEMSIVANISCNYEGSMTEWVVRRVTRKTRSVFRRYLYLVMCGRPNVFQLFRFCILFIFYTIIYTQALDDFVCHEPAVQFCTYLIQYRIVYFTLYPHAYANVMVRLKKLRVVVHTNVKN